MSSSPKQLFTELSGQGPDTVLRGDTAVVGLPGEVFTPRSGNALPAVVFGHGYLQPANRYAQLLRHLASWGIVAVAPDTQKGVLPSHRLFNADLRTTLDVCTGVRLGVGDISVDPEKLGLAGHSMGASTAVLAAAEDPRVRAVGTLALAESRPSALDAAREITVPGMHIAAAEDKIAPPVGHAEVVANAWAGPVQLRVLPKIKHLGFTEGRHWSELLLDGKPQYAAQRAAKALLTAFFLVHLAGQKQYRPLLEGDLKAAPLSYEHESFATARR
jgi:dienelactone hydrolase